MNERIKQLAIQADIKFLDFHGREYCEAWVEQQEKFAELIVKECGVALRPMLRDMVSRGKAYDLIKEHFGVEE
jgi:hypothetical protein